MEEKIDLTKPKPLKLVLLRTTRQGWGCGSATQCLPRLHEALGLIPSVGKK
jgi:hypothetical protein